MAAGESTRLQLADIKVTQMRSEGREACLLTQSDTEYYTGTAALDNHGH